MSTACKSCGAPVIWAVTVKGARMPVDQAPADDGNVVLIMSERGTEAIVVSSPDEHPGVVRRKSHFATCANAAQHRKPRA